MKDKKELTAEELSTVNGGGFWEGEAGGGKGVKYSDYWRCGISFKACAFTRDEYYIGGTRISKDKAETIVLHGNEVWKKYKDSADLVGFTREWKQILNNTYGIQWNGACGSKSFGF